MAWGMIFSEEKELNRQPDTQLPVYDGLERIRSRRVQLQHQLVLCISARSGFGTARDKSGLPKRIGRFQDTVTTLCLTGNPQATWTDEIPAPLRLAALKRLQRLTIDVAWMGKFVLQHPDMVFAACLPPSLEILHLIDYWGASREALGSPDYEQNYEKCYSRENFSFSPTSRDANPFGDCGEVLQGLYEYCESSLPKLTHIRLSFPSDTNTTVPGDLESRWKEAFALTDIAFASESMEDYMSRTLPERCALGWA